MNLMQLTYSLQFFEKLKQLFIGNGTPFGAY